MGQDSQQALLLLCRIVPGSQRRVQSSFVPRDDALDLPAISVDPLMESSLHLATISCLGPAPASVAPVERDDRTAYAQLLPAQPMIGFAVVAGIGQQSGQTYVPNRLAHRGRKLRMIVARSANHAGGCDQVALGVTDQRQLGPAATAESPVSTAIHEVGADVVSLQAGGINRAFGLWADQAALCCPPEDDGQQSLKSPFFISRCSA